jgi:hypothetical protein
MTYHYPDAVLMVFCKAPVPGQVKTRLIPTLSARQAADAHIALARHTLHIATKRPLCDVQLWCAPSPEHPFFQAAAQNFSVTLKTQQGNDLGARMADAFQDVLQNYAHALLIGCDCPSLTEADLAQALTVLQKGYDSVLAPTEDGGYSLIGLNQTAAELFAAMPWSTPQVLPETRARSQRLGLQCYELREQWDVDTPADWARYKQWCGGI